MRVRVAGPGLIPDVANADAVVVVTRPVSLPLLLLSVPLAVVLFPSVAFCLLPFFARGRRRDIGVDEKRPAC